MALTVRHIIYLILTIAFSGSPVLLSQQSFDINSIATELQESLGKDWVVAEDKNETNTLLIKSLFLVWLTGYVASPLLDDLDESDKYPYFIKLRFGPKISYEEYARLRDIRSKLLDQLYLEDQTKDEWRDLEGQLSMNEPPKYITPSFVVYLTPFNRFDEKIHPIEEWRKCELAHSVIARHFGREYKETD